MLQSVKTAIRHAVSNLCHVTNHSLNRLKGKVVILTYHRVVSEMELESSYIQPGMYVHAGVFKKHVSYLKEHFQVLSFRELLQRWDESTLDAHQRYCVITFDDGWLDNYLYAFPILKKYELPSTIFLPTDLIGTHQWFWPEQLGYLLSHPAYIKKRNLIGSFYEAYPWFYSQKGSKNPLDLDAVIESCKERPPSELDAMITSLSKILDIQFPENRIFVNWEEVQEMSLEGISFGSHSCSHKILTGLPSKEARDEINRSLKTLHSKGINTVPIFCYPNGNYSEKTMDRVKRAGYDAAVGTQSGLEDNVPHNKFCLKRIGIHQDISTTLPLFTFRISGIA